MQYVTGAHPSHRGPPRFVQLKDFHRGSRDLPGVGLRPRRFCKSPRLRLVGAGCNGIFRGRASPSMQVALDVRRKSRGSYWQRLGQVWHGSCSCQTMSPLYYEIRAGASRLPKTHGPGTSCRLHQDGPAAEEGPGAL